MFEAYPLSLKQAKRFVSENHSHNKAPHVHIFSIGVKYKGKPVGVGCVALPSARALMDGYSCEITRLCVSDDAPKNACSFLYGRLCRAAFAMGYLRIYTYSLESERSSSIKASGFKIDSYSRNKPNFRKRRQTYQTRIIGTSDYPLESKIRWIRRASNV
tara:strand:- start:2695 stop:3171 length:477 start_codon:yes stop_codon:yes gene_type:complete